MQRMVFAGDNVAKKPLCWRRSCIVIKPDDSRECEKHVKNAVANPQSMVGGLISLIA